MSIARKITSMALGGIVVLGMAGAALAAPAVATSNVNVRSGPGTGYGVVDTLRRGVRVDVQGCQGGWCYIEKSGPDGWVSWQYLAEASRPTRPSATFQFNFGTPPRMEPPRRPEPGRPGPSRPGPGRPGDDGPGRPGSGSWDNNGNGPGRPGNNNNGPRFDNGNGNGRPNAQNPCAIGSPGFPFC